MGAQLGTICWNCDNLNPDVEYETFGILVGFVKSMDSISRAYNLSSKAIPHFSGFDLIDSLRSETVRNEKKSAYVKYL